MYRAFNLSKIANITLLSGCSIAASTVKPWGNRPLNSRTKLVRFLRRLTPAVPDWSNFWRSAHVVISSRFYI